MDNFYISWDACAKEIVDTQCMSTVSWKRSSATAQMLEHLSHSDAVIYLNMSRKYIDDEQIRTLIETNDLFGDFYKYDHEGIMGSPTSFRYVFHALEILRLYNCPVPIVEIGGGYGGLCVVISKLAKMLNINIPKYYIIDTPNVSKLQNYYIRSHASLSNVSFEFETVSVDNFSILDSFGSGFYISNYALAEFSEVTRNKYIQSITKSMIGAYFAWNSYADLSWLPHTEFNNSFISITQEYPETGPVGQNKIAKFISNNFVSVDLIGGLGNKLFQIATCASYALKTNKRLVFVNNGFNPHCAIDPEITKVLFPYIEIKQLQDIEQFTEISEKQQFVYSELPNVDKNVFLKGYFQSYKYFDPQIINLIRKQLNNKPPNNSYFFHVRRTDYLTVPHLNLDLTSHYTNGLNEIKQKDPSANFIVFSDDIDWCKNNLQNLYPGTVWEWSNYSSAIETLSAMISCPKGGICANSTLSWWAAYLGSCYKERTYYLPKPWISNESPDELYFNEI